MNKPSDASKAARSAPLISSPASAQESGDTSAISTSAGAISPSSPGSVQPSRNGSAIDLPVDQLAELDEGETSKPTVGQLSLMFSNAWGERLRFNQLTEMMEFDGRELPEELVNLLYVQLSQADIGISKNAAIDAILFAAMGNGYHPIREYFDALLADDDIKPADIDTLATTYLGTSDPLYDAMLAGMVVGAVQRVRDPGSQMDYCLTLKGEQGEKKSTWLEALCGHQDWYCSTKQHNNKDLMMVIGTSWLIELAELETLTAGKEAGDLKAMITDKVCRYRKPYGKGLSKEPRGSIFVASVNTTDFLRDPTGNRRFWVIPTGLAAGEHLDLDLVRRDRDRIWKAGHRAYEAGRMPMLSPEQEAESARRNAGFMVENVFTEPLRKWIEGRGWRNKGPHHEFTTDEAIVGAEICTQIGNIKTGMQRKVAEALRELGFEQDANQKTVRGKKQPRRWRRPATSDDLGSEEPSEAGQTANGEGDPSDQPRITTQEIDLRVGKLLEDGPGMGAASERGHNAPKPLVGSGFDVTSDDSRSERGIPPLNLDCPF